MRLELSPNWGPTSWRGDLRHRIPTSKAYFSSLLAFMALLAVGTTIVNVGTVGSWPLWALGTVCTVGTNGTLGCGH